MYSRSAAGPPTFMKQQGFHVAEKQQQGFHVPEGAHWRAKPQPEVLPSSSSVVSASSRLADGLQGLMDMCNAGSLTPSAVNASADGSHVEVVATTHATPGVRQLVKAVIRGLKACQDPERATEGLGGTYFFKDDSGRKVAIVKPCDEEPLAPNNPKGFVGRALGEPGLKPTVRVGEAAIREVAAYLLDHDHFARVPHTVLVKFTHPIFHVHSSKPPSPRPEQQDESEGYAPSQASLDSSLSMTSLIQAKHLGLDSDHNDSSRRKSAESSSRRQSTESARPETSKLGSLQEFVLHDCDTNEMGAALFSMQDVHRIAILDIRLFNTDRHAGNMLVQRPQSGAGRLTALERLNQPQCRLLPIDHGFCLPEALEPPYFEWLHWPQAMMPFSEEELAYIQRLDAAADVALLQQQLPSLRVESLRTLQVATALLKRCAAAGLNLSEIGTIMSRPLVGLDEDPSDLEKMCAAAREDVGNAIFSSEDEEDEGGLGVGYAYDDDDMAMPMPAIGFQDSQARLSGVSGAVSLDSSALHLSVYSQDSTHSMQSSPVRSSSDLVPKADDMLFDLDEEHSISGSPPPAALDTQSHAAHSAGKPPMPITFTLNESSSSDFGTYSPVGDSRGTATPGGAHRGVHWGPLQHSYASSLASHKAFGTELMARSVDQSHFLPKGNFTKSKLQPGRKAHRRMHRLRKAAPAYPPPVAGAAPQAANAVFSDLTVEEWNTFMLLLLEYIDEGLADERWRQDVKKGRGTHAMQNMGVSCPRF